MPRRLIIPCDELRHAYLAGQSSKTIAERYGCSPTTIINRLRRCGIAVRPPRFQAKRIPQAALQRFYRDERWPIARIADYFGVAVSTITNKRHEYNIPARPRCVPPAGEDLGEG